MKKRSLLLLAALALASTEASRAQFGTFGDIPIEITAEGETRFVDGVAVAENNVSIHYGTVSIYADYAQYSPETREVLVSGNVRVYRDGNLFVGDRALYNFETKLLRTGAVLGAAYPFIFEGESISSLDGSGALVYEAGITTSDSSKPDYRFKARSLKIYPGDHVVLSDAQLIIGETPVFWFPFYYQSLNRNDGFSFVPGFDGRWGGYLLTRFGFPISEKVHGMLHLDLRTKRGAAIGIDLNGNYGHDNKSWMRLQTYYAHDLDVSANPTALKQEEVSADRYRVSFQSRTFFTEDIYGSADLNKLSDRRFLRDFYPNEYRNNPQPDNVVSLTKKSESYTLTGIVRVHPNNFFDTTQRLPEVVLDVKRQPLFNIPWLFYEGETGVASLRRDFAKVDDVSTTPFSSYQAVRLDSFHQLLAPQTLGGWLSVVPRIGYRGTYYSKGAESVFDEVMPTLDEEGLDLTQDARTLFQRATGGPLYRNVFNAGIESSFKFSREWNDVQSRTLGLDGLRHIVQPYTNLSFVYSDRDPEEILQFDRLNPSTQLPPLDFPQFTTIDTIPSWSIWRFGARNRWQTRRDDRTLNWLEMDTFLDINLKDPDFPGTSLEKERFSNVFYQLKFNPVPWASLGLDSQIPVFNNGFSQVNTTLNFMPTRDMTFNVSHRYLNGNRYFQNSSNVRFGGYYRIDDNWGFSFREQYEFRDNVLEIQEYAVHRDLSSWVASLGFQVRDNFRQATKNTSSRSVTDYSVILTFTLKDFPAVTLPVSYDPSSLIND